MIEERHTFWTTKISIKVIYNSKKHKKVIRNFKMQVTNISEHLLSAFGYGTNGFHCQRMENDWAISKWLLKDYIIRVLNFQQFNILMLKQLLSIFHKLM